MMTIDQIENMWYVDFMAFLNETNRCPWAKDSIRQLIQNTYLNAGSNVLDVWCNTGYVSFEIARTIKCNVTWVDINKNMISQSNDNLILNSNKIQKLLNFQVSDAENLPFKDKTFDLVTSWWSTVFIPNKKKALIEYKRVCKDWWFIGDINFFYTNEIPKETINKINNLLGIEIEAWKMDYFWNLYDSVGLEKYYIYTNDVYRPSEKELKEYCRILIKESILSKETDAVQNASYDKLYWYMNLFVENNIYLSYGVFIYRNRPSKFKEQIALFWY